MSKDKGPIDYDALKKRGFLKAKQDGYFVLRTRMLAGNYNALHFEKLAEISKRYGHGILHMTTRQGVEIPFIKFEDIKEVEKEIIKRGIQAGTSGPRLRAITCCPGSNWCKRGLVDTFSLCDKIENERSIKCGTDLPHKLKIAISGCPNACTRAQTSEIGIHGQIDTSGPERKTGYAVYLGGCGGKTPRTGFKLNRIYSEEEALSLIEKVIDFFKKNAKPRQRLGALIEEVGKENFLKLIK